ncbi:type II toxin-antitoxin system HipA family toxin [Thalassospira profundimaris]|uniref:type II toxin-antitoxin system HipA family toxin n=1 Tax=Thalassospira profundimaris TaxID=502049 RepID=UPI000DEE009F|nr:type II toxin-antitoxin system HipA family toxin [Thalassospira profundimaris]
MNKSLLVLANGQDRVGTLNADDRGYMSFEYAPEWLARSTSYPVSQSIPLRTGPFDHTAIEPFFDGLLPDKKDVRRQIGELFDVAPTDEFGMLEHIGRDCAGALMLIHPDQQATSDAPEPHLMPIAPDDLAHRIAELPQRPLFIDEDEVVLSLAGVNDKAAVYIDPDSGAISLPIGGYPSTHILKIDIERLPDSTRTEHFCLKLARTIGLDAAHTKIRIYNDRPVLFVTRFDRAYARTSDGMRVTRLHQEDFCQATGINPDLKYEKQGGPDLAAMFAMTKKAATVPARDIPKLLGFVIFNVLIGNPDAHAKNYSLIYRQNPKSVQTAISPLYDVNNGAAFRDCFKSQRPRLAQSIGGEFDPTKLDWSHWESQARTIGSSPTALRKQVKTIAKKLQDALKPLREELRNSDADSPRLDIIVDDVSDRCKHWLTQLG